MYNVVIVRDLFFDGQASLGTILVYNDKDDQVYKKESLERGWVNNQNRVSCVPVGTYDLVLEYSDKFDTELWELKDVPNRSECKIHAANYWKQLNGCIAPGNNRKYLDNDVVMDITSSRDSLKLFHEAMKDETRAKIHIFDALMLTKKII